LGSSRETGGHVGKIKKCVGVISFSWLFVFVRSDEERTHESVLGMICDVHFGDTRNDSTPATPKWLPNDHTEEQYTTNKYARIIWLLQTQDKRRGI
jgi:hypothetical protein